jgi:hypothetical protein
VDLAAVVIETRDFEPVRLRVDHAPPDQVVDRGAPQHCLLAASVHRDVAADARRIGGRRIHGKDELGPLGRIGDATRDDARFTEDRRRGLAGSRQFGRLNLAERFELLCVDHGCERRERNGAPGVARAAAARNDGQAQLDA